MLTSVYFFKDQGHYFRIHQDLKSRSLVWLKLVALTKPQTRPAVFHYNAELNQAMQSQVPTLFSVTLTATPTQA